MLNKQLQEQIINDAEELTKGFKDTNNYEAGIIQGYKEGYEDAGEKYASLWQAAEEKAAKYEKALKELRKSMPDRSGFANLIDNTLTPKQGSDE